MIFDKKTLDDLSALAKTNTRLRQSFDLRNTDEDTSQRMLNALEPGTVLPIHCHTNTSETMIVIRGTLKELLYNNNGQLIEEVILKAGSEHCIIQLERGQWHSLECLEEGTIIFEAKDGEYKPLDPTDILKK